MVKYFVWFGLGSAIFLAACTKPAPSDSLTASDEALLVVTTASPQIESYPVTIAATGLIQPWQETIISAEIGGLDISNVYVNVGATVKKGQLLAELNAAQVNADLLNQRANVAEAEANLEQATIEASKAVSLEKAGALSAQELLNYSTKQKTTQAKLIAAKASLELQNLKLSYTKILAPDDGVISARNAAVGSVVSNGGELFRLIRNNRLEWQAEVPLSQLQDIVIGQSVLLNLSDGRQLAGEVRQVAPALNPNSKNGIAYVDISNNTQLKVGMSIDGLINVGYKRGIVIPFRALVSSDGFNYVMTLNQKHQVHKVKVQVGDIYGDKAVIISGISPAAVIAVEGAGFLDESQIVAVKGTKK